MIFKWGTRSSRSLNSVTYLLFLPNSQYPEYTHSERMQLTYLIRKSLFHGRAIDRRRYQLIRLIDDDDDDKETKERKGKGYFASTLSRAWGIPGTSDSTRYPDL